MQWELNKSMGEKLFNNFTLSLSISIFFIIFIKFAYKTHQIIE